MEDYFIDYPHLLKINLDYSKEISLEIVEDKGSIVPIMKYLGTDKQSGNNVISNLEKIISIFNKGKVFSKKRDIPDVV